MRGRPPKEDRTQEAEAALEQWLQGPRPAEPEDEHEKRVVREALGETAYMVEHLND